MKNIYKFKALSFLFFLIWFYQEAYACSMYKLTVDNKTMVGCNQDAWRTTTSIWFEKALNETEYGACFTGSRLVGPDEFAPHSGMNEEGLVFSRLDAYHPIKNLIQGDKKKIQNEVHYLKNIMHQCKNIKEVKRFIEMYDHSFFNSDVFIYVDRMGNYLVVEPYKIIEGNDPSYVLANFCPSLTNNENARKQTKYKKGEDFLKVNEIDSSLDFCQRLSDTMSVCRNRNGDGTLLTSIWDTQNGVVNLYFYHSYDTTVQFNIANELALGNHTISIPELFPINNEFRRLIDYKTPFNQNYLRIVLVLLGGLMCFLSFINVISYFRKKGLVNVNFIRLAYAGINMVLFFYLFVLATNINVFYFDAPYQDPNSNLISLSSYTPFLLILTFIPITYFTFMYLKHNRHSVLMKSSLITNNMIYILLLFAFSYWGLFNVVNSIT